MEELGALEDIIFTWPREIRNLMAGIVDNTSELRL